MDKILEIIYDIPITIIILYILVILLILLCLILLKSNIRLEKKYRKLMRGVNSKNLEELVTKYLDGVDECKKSVECIANKTDDIESKINRCIQKTAVLRYRAFEDVGCDLSFSIALLDANDDGVVITGIYGRNESTAYAKPIDKGISRYELSDEESEVLKNAIQK